MNQSPRRRRRLAAAVLAGAATFAAVGASAASLGGITASTLGADKATVTSCDTDGVGVSFTNAYDATLLPVSIVGGYKTTTVTVTGIAAACTGKSLNLTVKDSTGASLGNGSVASISGTTAAVTLSGTVSAKDIEGVAIVITG